MDEMKHWMIMPACIDDMTTAMMVEGHLKLKPEEMVSMWGKEAPKKINDWYERLGVRWVKSATDPSLVVPGEIWARARKPILEEAA